MGFNCMLKWLSSFLILLVSLCGCTRNVYQQASHYHDDGRCKPTVALIPVFDRSGAETSWNLSEEFTEQLRQRFLKQNNFYLKTPDEINAETETLSESNSPFTSDCFWIAQAFKEEEYVIFTELVEHDFHPKQSKEHFLSRLTPSYELSMTMRVRVFDLRKGKPAVVLQELVHQNHLVPKPSSPEAQAPGVWKKKTFFMTPIGIAHAQFSKEIAKRIEEYVLLSKSD